MSYAIAVDDSSWARLSTFKGVIVGNAFFCFTLASPFAYPLKVCSNKNGNDPYASLLESFLKSALKDWARYPMVSLTVAATILFIGPCKNLTCLMACVKSTKTSCLCQWLDPSRKTSLPSPIDFRDLHYSYQAWMRLDLVSSTLLWIAQWFQHQSDKRVNHTGDLWQSKIRVQLDRWDVSE